MPRTKISKSSKRNREAAQREEKIREFDQSVDQFKDSLDSIGLSCIKNAETDINLMVYRIKKSLLQMNFAEFFQLSLLKLEDWTGSTTGATSALSVSALGQNSNNSQSFHSSSTMRSTKGSNPNDEGYLTEDSTTGGSSAGSLAAFTGITQLQQQRGRTPGPFSSAKARRPRRSKSFCDEYKSASAIKQKLPTISTTAEHSSRSKLRTPQAPRPKALSADRSVIKVGRDSPTSPPTAFRRWPKPGEMVLSVTGSPLVAQVLPEKFANVNIPVKNGVLSLGPKKIAQLKPEIIEAIDADTINQIKTLQASLNLIINSADQAGLV